MFVKNERQNYKNMELIIIKNIWKKQKNKMSCLTDLKKYLNFGRRRINDRV